MGEGKDKFCIGHFLNFLENLGRLLSLNKCLTFKASFMNEVLHGVKSYNIKIRIYDFDSNCYLVVMCNYSCLILITLFHVH